MPQTYPFRQVDAFTRVPLGGNPAAIIYDADNLTDDQMLAITREMNLSETAFVLRSQVADFKLRYFTTKSEIPMAGHPTIATFHALAEDGRINGEGHVQVTQELSIGVLPVELELWDDQPQRIIMTQKPPQFLETLDPLPWAEALGIAADDLLPDVPVQIVSTGTRQVMVPVRSLEVLERLDASDPALRFLHSVADWYSVHVFTPDAYDEGNSSHARHFDPGASPFEDPVTGSATGGMACYLYRYGLVNRVVFTCEQGHIMGRPGLVDVELDGTPQDITSVRIAGPAVTVLRGELTL